jgi:hypothetical protein
MRYGFQFEPALWMGLVRAVVMGASAWGFDLTQEQTFSIYAIAEAVTSLVTRSYSAPLEPRP